MVAHVWPVGHPNTERPASTSEGLGYAIGLAAWFLVGGMFVAAKYGIEEIPPWTMCFWRLSIATLVLLPLVWRERQAMLAFLRKRGLEAFVIGALGLGLTQGLVYSAMSFTSAINCGIIFSIAPIITLVLAGIFLHEPMGRWQFLGSAIAFAGIVVIAVQGSLAVLLGLRLGGGDLLVFVAAITFAAYTVLLKRAKFDLARLPLLVILLVSGVVVTFPGSLVEVWYGQHSDVAFRGLVALAYAAIPGGALMYLLYNWSVDLLGASKAGALTYTQMIFTTFLAWLILGETVAWYHVAGVALIIVGVLFVELLKAKPASSAPATRQ